MSDFNEPDPNSASFGEWLKFLLYVHGTRPTGSPDKPGVPWEKKDFVAQIEKTATAVGYWLADEKLPDDLAKIERQLFGSSNKYDHWRKALRAARARGHVAKRRSASQFATLSNFVAKAPSSQSATEQSKPAIEERALGFEITDDHLAPYDADDGLREAEEDSIRLGIRVRTPAAQFLRGAETKNWAVINSVAVPRRDHEDRITQSIFESRLTIVSAAAGDGKTTICKRVALRLRSAGWRVFYATAPDEILQDLGLYRFKEGRTAVFIDNAEYMQSFGTIGSLLSKNPDVQVVLIGRHHQIVEKQKSIHHLNPSEHFVSHADDLIAVALAERIVQHHAGLGLDEIEVLAAIRRNISEKQTHFLAIMISATRGESFSKYILSMIRQFSASGDDWILRSIAMVSLVSGLSKHSQFFLDSPLLTHLSMQHLATDRPSSVKLILERVDSELVRRSHAVTSSNRIALSLRHPDIEKAVLQHFYDISVGDEVGNVDDFESDLAALCLAATLRTMEKMDTDPSRRVGSLSVQIIETLLTASNAWIPKESIISVARKCADLWGQSEADKAQARRYISPILRMQLAGGLDGVEDIRTTGERYFQLDGADPNLLAAWLNLEFESGNVGSPECEFSARWIGCKYLSIAGQLAPHFMTSWRQAEFQAGNLGSIDQICSARWIAFQYLSKAKEFDPNFMVSWLQEEFVSGNAGSHEQPYSARWIGHEYLSKAKEFDPGFMASWLKYEFEAGNAGSRERPYSARWIAHEYLSKAKEFDSNFMASWLKHEFEAGNAGSREQPYSARWIGHEYLSKAKEFDPNFMASWLKHEFEAGNAGSHDQPYSARWIARQLMAGDKVPNSTAISTWMKAELLHTEAGCTIGEARRIAGEIGKQAWERGARGEDLLRKIIENEYQSENLGSRDVKWSALWYFWAYWTAGYRGESVATMMLVILSDLTSEQLDEVSDALKSHFGETNFDKRFDKVQAQIQCGTAGESLTSIKS